MGENQIQEITKAELCRRLSFTRLELHEELYESELRDLAQLDVWRRDLDTKATALLAAAGLAITVLSANSQRLAHLPRWLSLLVAMSSVLGLMAALMATFALFIREHVRPNDTWRYDMDLLDPKMEYGGKVPAEELLARYKAQMIADLFSVRRKALKVHKQKADWLQIGQVCFVAFLVGMVAAMSLHGI